jgi:hypothetical protein
MNTHVDRHTQSLFHAFSLLRFPSPPCLFPFNPIPSHPSPSPTLTLRPFPFPLASLFPSVVPSPIFDPLSPLCNRAERESARLPGRLPLPSPSRRRAPLTPLLKGSPNPNTRCANLASLSLNRKDPRLLPMTSPEPSTTHHLWPTLAVLPRASSLSTDWAPLSSLVARSHLSKVMWSRPIVPS